MPLIRSQTAQGRKARKLRRGALAPEPQAVCRCLPGADQGMAREDLVALRHQPGKLGAAGPPGQIIPDGPALDVVRRGGDRAGAAAAGEEQIAIADALVQGKASLLDQGPRRVQQGRGQRVRDLPAGEIREDLRLKRAFARERDQVCPPAHVAGQQVDAPGQGLKRGAARVVPRRIIAQNREVRHVRPRGHALGDRAHAAYNPAACQKIQIRRPGNRKRRPAAQGLDGPVGHAVEEDNQILHIKNTTPWPDFHGCTGRRPCA